jgi:hypothetical protein
MPPMNAFVKHPLAVCVLFWAGCATDRHEPAEHGFLPEFREEIAALRACEIAMPTTTPYDNKEGAREAYLDYFRRSYRIHVTGSIIMTCCSAPEPWAEAKFRGWSDGRSAATKVFHESLQTWITTRYGKYD